MELFTLSLCKNRPDMVRLAGQRWGGREGEGCSCSQNSPLSALLQSKQKQVGKMETWGMAESSWQGWGEGFGVVWGNLGRMDIPSPAPSEDEGTSGHHARPRPIPEQSWGVPAPRHICKGSQIVDYSLQLLGICISARQAAAPSNRQGHFKDKTIFPLQHAGPRSSMQRSRHGAAPSGQEFWRPRGQSHQEVTPVASQKEPGEGERPRRARTKAPRSSPLAPPRCVASLRLPLLTYGGSCLIKKKKKIQAAQSFPFRQLHP